MKYLNIWGGIGVISKGFTVAPLNKEVYENILQLYSYYDGERVSATYSINSSVATISTDGLITFNAEGTAEVTISYNENSVTRIYTYKYYEILKGFELNNSGQNVANADMSIVGPIKCIPSIQIKWGVINGTLGRLCEYNETKTFIDYWVATVNPRTITVSNITKYVKAAFQTSMLDYAYIYDVTNQTYLYRGSKVS